MVRWPERHESLFTVDPVVGNKLFVGKRHTVLRRTLDLDELVVT
jgi:hypothetical protein